MSFIPEFNIAPHSKPDMEGFPLKKTSPREVQMTSAENLVQGMRVLLVAYECTGSGFKYGGLGETVHGMAKSLKERGCNLTLLLPKFTGLPSALLEKITRGTQSILRHPVAGEIKEDRVWTIREDGQTCVYLEDSSTVRNVFEIASFIEMYTDGNLAIPGKPWLGLKERMAYLSSAVAEYVVAHAQEFDAVLYNDWHVAYAISRIVKRHFSRWVCGEFPANVFVIHNNACGYQGEYAPGEADVLAKFGDRRPQLNVMVEALGLADRTVTVSESFAMEMQEGPMAADMDPWVRKVAHEGRFKGIINGGNPDLWNPETNDALANWIDPVTSRPVDLTFSPRTADLVAHRGLIRQQLFRALNRYYPEALHALGYSSEKEMIKNPLFLYVGRYDACQKGLDKLKDVMLAAKKRGGRLIMMGVGEDMGGATAMMDALQELAAIHKCAWITRGDKTNSSLNMQLGDKSRGIPALGPLIRAAADFCVVPSSFEPCGLVQSEGWLFGALAIGTKTGGLADTIVADPAHPRFNGFTFARLDAWESQAQSDLVTAAVDRAQNYWEGLDMGRKHALIAKLMIDGRQLSWTTSPVGPPPVDRYLAVLGEAIAAKQGRLMYPASFKSWLKEKSM